MDFSALQTETSTGERKLIVIAALVLREPVTKRWSYDLKSYLFISFSEPKGSEAFYSDGEKKQKRTSTKSKAEKVNVSLCVSVSLPPSLCLLYHGDCASIQHTQMHYTEHTQLLIYDTTFWFGQKALKTFPLMYFLCSTECTW